jgi:hypothetical protein
MATYSRREYTTRHIEYTVPCDGLWGACWAEVDKAMQVAAREFRQVHGLSQEAALSDDALRFFPGDDEIVIRFEVKGSGDD